VGNSLNRPTRHRHSVSSDVCLHAVGNSHSERGLVVHNGDIGFLEILLEERYRRGRVLRGGVQRQENILVAKCEQSWRVRRGEYHRQAGPAEDGLLGERVGQAVLPHNRIHVLCYQQVRRVRRRRRVTRTLFFDQGNLVTQDSSSRVNLTGGKFFSLKDFGSRRGLSASHR